MPRSDINQGHAGSCLFADLDRRLTLACRTQSELTSHWGQNRRFATGHSLTVFFGKLVRSASCGLPAI